MSFANLALDLESMPTAQQLELRPMDPRYKKEVRTQHALVWGILTLVSLIPFIVVVKPPGLRFGLMFVPIFFAVAGVGFTWLASAMAGAKKMALREHDVVLRSGLWWHKTVILPRNRVQHIELSQGPLQRRFGLASLKFYTAGGASIDLQIDGLSQDAARRLRDHVMGRPTP